MLWKKPWAPEAVLGLVGGVVASFVFGNVAAGLLRQAGVHGFRTDFSIGTVLLATLSFHGAVVVLGTAFLRVHNENWRDVFVGLNWKRTLVLPPVVLAVATPVILGLKAISEMAMQKLHWTVEDQMAVEMVLNAKPLMCAYLGFFAVVLAPLAEEFFFRGLLFPLIKQFRLPALVQFFRRGGHPRFAWFLRRQFWRILAWVGVSLLFALIHFNAPTFLSLFVLALALTWLYEKTEGLLAPIIAHSLFNLVNLVLLLLSEKYQPAGP